MARPKGTGKRTDLKGRTLNQGETQVKEGPAKGQYIFSYTDVDHVQRKVRSWRLKATDVLPAGKRPCQALRDMEKPILQRLQAGNMAPTRKSLNDCVEEYLERRQDLRTATKYDYQCTFNKYIKPSKLGARAIADIHYTDVRSFYIDIILHSGAPSAALGVNVLLKPVFADALRNELITRDPVTGALAEAQQRCAIPKKEREPLTPDQVARFLDFLQTREKWRELYRLSVVALNTGLRAGELFGLTWDRIDLKAGVITVDRQLAYSNDGTGYAYRFQDVKTKAGRRVVPILTPTRQMLEEIKREPVKRGAFLKVDGVGGFVFLTHYGRLWREVNNAEQLHDVVNAYNAQCEPGQELPAITMHIFRHTFASRLCCSTTNLKYIQSVMGHGSISVTMDIYAKMTENDIINSVSDLDSKIAAL